MKLDIKAIRKKRKELRLSQENVAGFSKITLATYSRMETGRGSPSIDTVIRVCKVLGLTASDVFGDK